MTAAIYSLSAVLAAALATRAWLLDRDDPARRAFMGLGWSLGIAYLCFALSFLPGLDVLRAGWTVAGGMAPAFAWATVDAMFPGPGGPTRTGGRLIRLALVVTLVASILHGLGFGATPRASVPEVWSGIFAYLVGAATLWRSWTARNAAELPAERTRLTWLLGLSTTAAVLSAAEWIARNTQPVVDKNSLAFLDRGLALQGAIPPISSVFVAAVVYLLYLALQARRLVTLQELLARMLALTVSAGLLVAAQAITSSWVALTQFPLHSSFLLFLVSAVFLSVYAAGRHELLRWAGRVVDARGQDLEDAVHLLGRELPRCTTSSDLAGRVVDCLHASGRFEAASVWILDLSRGAFVLTAEAGPGEPLTVVAPSPIDEAFDTGEAGYVHGTHAVLDELLPALGSDLIVPCRHDGAVLGWIGVKDPDWSDGFSDDDLRRLAHVAESAALVLANFETFRQRAEERRLAALGAMAAGLAHEIRNPLAGIKGAAQVLQDTPLDGEELEMLGVVVDETDCLDRVVSDFLSFARPFSLHPESTDATELAGVAARVLRAEGLADDVTLELVAPAPVPVRVDAGRLEQVLLNLLRNARDAVGEAGRIVLTTTSLPEGTVRIDVTDDGPGVDAEARAQLFTPFFTTKHDGTGLGLAISRRLIDAHGGSLTHVQPPDGGTTFRVELPGVAPAAAAG